MMLKQIRPFLHWLSFIVSRYLNKFIEDSHFNPDIQCCSTCLLVIIKNQHQLTSYLFVEFPKSSTMLNKSCINHLASFERIFTILFILTTVKTALSDEARAIIADSVSRSHQEVVPPELDHDSIDDGPIVSPIYPKDHSNFLDSLSSSSGNDHEEPHRYPLIRMDFTYAKPVIILLWILISALAKFGKLFFLLFFFCIIPISLKILKEWNYNSYTYQTKNTFS